MTYYSGLCAGGPHDGTRMAAAQSRIIVAIPPPSMTLDEMAEADKFTTKHGVYKFNKDVGMWIWQNEWKSDD
jgi:hypothetical protein